MKLFNVVVIEGYGACSAIVAADTLAEAKRIVSESKGMYEESEPSKLAGFLIGTH